MTARQIKMLIQRMTSKPALLLPTQAQQRQQQQHPQPASQPASQPIHPSVHHLSSCLVSTPTRFGQATSFERSLSCESANCARVCRLPLMILQRQRCDCRQQFKNSTRPMSVFCFRLVFFSLCPFLGSCCRVLLPRTRSTYLVTLLQTHHLFASR